MSPEARADAFHGKLAGWLERTFNPIMLKELRGSLRGARFFVAHLTILSLFAAGLLLTLGAMMASESTSYGPGSNFPDPSRVGQGVFLITQLLQLGVVFLVVPGLAATSISSERESLTHDLLLTTTLTARQIVWGKFTAAMTQAVTIFVSMVPLVGLCFLFGGITIYQILANYAFLLAFSAVMIAYALSMSASARSTQRSVGSVYALAMIAGILIALLLGATYRSGVLGEMGVAYGFMAPNNELRYRGPIAPFERAMYVHIMPGFIWASLIAFFFINATNRLKPIYANRSTPFRIYYAAVILGLAALMILTYYHEYPEGSTAYSRTEGMMGYAICALALGLMGSLFACEEYAPRRTASILAPGSDSGTLFTIAVNGLFAALSFVSFIPFSRGFSRGMRAALPDFYPTGAAFLTVFLWSAFCALFARFLSAVMPGRPLLMRTILVLTCLFLATFPLVHWAIADAIDRDETDPQRRNGPITLLLSPVMAILSELDLSTMRRDFPLNAGGIPVTAGFAGFAVLTSVAFFWLGNRARRKALLESSPPAPAPKPDMK